LAPTLEQAADGVWLMRGGFPHRIMNVYLIEDGGGVTVFDAGIKDMTKWIRQVGDEMGGIERVVLGHGHEDHRGAAPGLDAPVICHPDEKPFAESKDPSPYFHLKHLDRLKLGGRYTMPLLLRLWDGGPVKIASTVSEGDRIAGFDVVHFPGHAPGLIGLWREPDRLALVSDTLYTLDPQTGAPGHPRVPHAAFNRDTEQARASLRKLAALEPEVVWAGHAEPVRGDVRAQLEHAADTT